MCLSDFSLCTSHIIISRGPMSPQPREDRMNLGMGISPVCAAFSSSLFVGRILPVNPIFHTPTSTQTPPKAGPARTTQASYISWDLLLSAGLSRALVGWELQNHGHG
ncbi:uncharacterized protein CLUP02_07687 [Colletotrichum lupini]|uniref:Uncharacterized protein n=1 Tax=Colletotrichum lupini TaxID=145971 RepID=A0A9Q8SRP8_9PEZI|nr:uncharacterized protein CLUP02_07687 [Colletotrichum lupini]UQC82200.1 hypothetical protein CLUP02_07687 [Colletotrichum lupini]